MSSLLLGANGVSVSNYIKTAIAAILTMFSVNSSAGDGLSSDEEVVFDKAMSTVKYYINAGKQFPLFAVVLTKKSEVKSLLASDEFSDQDAALTGLLQQLSPMARNGEIVTSILVTPMSEPGEPNAAMFDVESKGGTRKMLLQLYTGSGEKVKFRKIQQTNTPLKLFAP